MILEELLLSVNDSTVVDIYSAESGEVISTYDGKDSIPERYNECDVMDIFVDGNSLCIEISE